MPSLPHIPSSKHSLALARTPTSLTSPTSPINSKFKNHNSKLFSPCWRELYNKSVSLIPYQLLPPYLRNECLNLLVNFFSLKLFKLFPYNKIKVPKN